MISALAWVPKGASKRTPQKLQLTDAEVAMMHELAKEEEEEEKELVEAAMEGSDVDADDSDDDNQAPAATTGGSSAADDLPAEFRMDEYDDEDNDAAIKNFLEGGNDMADLEDSDEEDGEGRDDEEDDDESDDGETAEDLDINMDSNAVFEEHDDDEDYDKEDEEILPTDSVILVANTEDDFSNLEVQVYDENSGALYVHHEINLPAFPLSLAWMDCAPVPLDPASGPVDGSFVAVGTFKPGIEIWNLDVLDVLEPAATLGGEVNDELRNVAVPKSMRKRKDKKAALKTGSHTDAVIALDWNSSHRNMLASGSADTTVKVWDITTQACLYTMNHHTNKVQSVRWNPVETTVLASAGFDRKIVVLDGRQPDACSKFELSGEVESLTWAPYDPTTIVASSEDGVVVAFDVRKNGSAPLFRFNAHSGAVSAISFSHKIPGMFATAGVDKTVKIWDLKDNSPVCITSKEMNVGELFAMSFYQDSPFMLGVGGSKGVLALWDTSENQGVERRFGSRVQAGGHAGNINLASTFRSPQQLADDLIREEEEAAARQQQSGGGKKSKSKGKKK